MKGQERKFKVKSAIMGGGFSLKEGQVVSEDQLEGYLDWLQLQGGVEEIHDGDSMSTPAPPRAFTA